MLPFSTVDNQHRLRFVATSLDEGFSVMGDGNEARLGAQFGVGRTLGARVPGPN